MNPQNGTPAATSIVDSTAVSGTVYYYVVNVTCDFSAGGTIPGGTSKTSRNSLEAMLTPKAPVVTGGVSNGQVNLSWPPVPMAAGYLITRTGGSQTLSTDVYRVTSWYDPGPFTQGVSYSYTVQAFTANNNLSAPSSPPYVYTPQNGPTAELQLSAKLGQCVKTLEDRIGLVAANLRQIIEGSGLRSFFLAHRPTGEVDWQAALRRSKHMGQIAIRGGTPTAAIAQLPQ